MLTLAGLAGRSLGFFFPVLSLSPPFVKGTTVKWSAPSPTGGPPPEGGPRSGESEERNGPLEPSGGRRGDSSTAGRNKKAPLQGLTPCLPPGQEGGTGPQAQVQHLSQNGYSISLSLSRSLSLSLGHRGRSRPPGIKPTRKLFVQEKRVQNEYNFSFWLTPTRIR